MADIKERIARRTAKELRDGELVNLGIGLPTMVGAFVPEDIIITLHSENGFAGLDSVPEEGKEDVDIINSGGQYVTVLPRVNYFDTATSFGIVRGGHVDVTVLGAMQVAQNGDLANWIIPGKKVAGMGGAMDLVVGAREVIIAMTHTQKGNHKILKECTLPLTAEKVVDMIITEMAVMKVTDKGIEVIELHPDFTKEQVQEATGCELIWSPDLKPYQED